MLFVLITICPTVGWIYRHLHITHSLSPFSPSQPSTTSCHRGRCQGEATPTSHQPPTSCPSQLSPPKTQPIRVSAARTTETLPLTSSFTSRQSEKQPDRQRQTDRWAGKMDRQVEIASSHKDTCTGIDLSVVRLRKRNTV